MAPNHLIGLRCNAAPSNTTAPTASVLRVAAGGRGARGALDALADPPPVQALDPANPRSPPPHTPPSSRRAHANTLRHYMQCIICNALYAMQCQYNANHADAMPISTGSP